MLYLSSQARHRGDLPRARELAKFNQKIIFYSLCGDCKMDVTTKGVVDEKFAYQLRKRMRLWGLRRCPVLLFPIEWRSKLIAGKPIAVYPGCYICDLTPQTIVVQTKFLPKGRRDPLCWALCTEHELALTIPKFHALQKRVSKQWEKQEKEKGPEQGQG